MTIAHRRDSFCGKMSACNNLKQYGIPYSLTKLHTEAPSSAEFKTDLEWFAGVCRVVKGVRNLRIGAIGARPAAFNTVRYSEKILEHNGISVETLDLSEVMGRIGRMKDDDPAAVGKLNAIQKYVSTSGIPHAGAAEDGEARCGRRFVDESCRRADQRGAMLDFAGREFGRRAVHDHEHDERFAAVERVRSRCVRRAGHARLAACFGNAERAARLEQQLRHRSEQGGLLPLQQFAEAFFSRSHDGFPGDHCGDRGQRTIRLEPAWAA